MSWREDADCLGMPPAIFFPSRFGSTAIAVRLCRSCPVRDDCLAEELTLMRDGIVSDGYRGGTTPQMRRLMLVHKIERLG